MRKIIHFVSVLMLALLPACGQPAPTETSAPVIVPTDTPIPLIHFVTPADGATVEYDELEFQVNPVPGAEGYSWTFMQNGNVLWDTIKNEQRLKGAEYRIPDTGDLNDKFLPGEFQVQVKTRINGVWTEPVTITLNLPPREAGYVPASQRTPTPAPTATLPPPAAGLVEIRWFVGLGAGTTENQQAIERNVVRNFNETHPNIKLTLQVVDYNQARDVLADQFRSGNGPDIVGPMGWQASSVFHTQWFDLSALIVDTGYDLSVFTPELVEQYQTDKGQVGLPFAVYPAAVFYNRRLFDKAQLAYPPGSYGETYQMPDGSQVEWDWDTLAEVARLLTLDSQGRNALDPAFDATHIVQYGFAPQYPSATGFASFWGADKLYDDNNSAVIPSAWRTAWKWYFNGMWGRQPFIPNQASGNTPRFGNGNWFSSANIAMAITQSWYIGPNLAGGQQWDFGALPTYKGIVNGRVDADTFRIWKGTPHPREAFEVLTYFLGPASTDLLRAYGGIPARTADQDAFFAARAQQYPFVKNWEVLKTGLNYPDIPSAEGYMPNFPDAWNRLNAFWNVLASNDTISFDAEVENLRRDLDNIFKR